MNWKINIQQAINWIDDKLEDELSLKEISNYLGYSEFHTSRKFKEYTGSTLKRYIMLRKLTKAAKELRDKNVRIIDTAFKYGFNSQEAFTKSFHKAFNINPGEYQKHTRPIPYILKKDVLFPDNLKNEGEIIMVKDEEIKIRLEEIKEHKLLYIKREHVDNYIDFWELVDSEEGMNCDQLHGELTSVDGLYPEGFGAFTNDGYLFGNAVDTNFKLSNKTFKEILIPTKKYLVFEHPGFKEEEFGAALNQVRRIALKEFDFELNGYEIDDSFVTAYEHSGLELCYYFIRIPLKNK
jgi:AraC family transcriptional regulator